MNKSLFGSSAPGRLIPKHDTTNAAGAPAYARSPEDALAQLAATGTLGSTFYVDAKGQLDSLLDTAAKCAPAWVMRCAIYARRWGRIKDAPAVLLAHLLTRDTGLFRFAFPLVVDNEKMLRNFVQCVRSGAVGRKSLGTAARKVCAEWLNARDGEQLFRASVGKEPALADVIRLAHPKPPDAAREVLYAYLLGRPVAALGVLPEVVQRFEAAKLGAGEPPYDLDFRMLTSLKLTQRQWTEIALRMSWQTLRMNLNTLQRHNVFDDVGATTAICARLCNPELIARARAFPIQVYAAAKFADGSLPLAVRQALAKAADLTTQNVPVLPGRTMIGVDVSGSMRTSYTGKREAASKLSCLEAAAVFSAALAWRNSAGAVLAPFTEELLPFRSTSTSLLGIANDLARLPGGGTDCSVVIEAAAAQKADTCILVSDNMSWARPPAVMSAWRHLKAVNPAARLVCIDLVPTLSSSIADEPDVLHVGGFSDDVFAVLGDWLANNTTWRETINARVEKLLAGS